MRHLNKKERSQFADDLTKMNAIGNMISLQKVKKNTVRLARTEFLMRNNNDNILLNDMTRYIHLNLNKKGGLAMINQWTGQLGYYREDGDQELLWATNIDLDAKYGDKVDQLLAKLIEQHPETT